MDEFLKSFINSLTGLTKDAAVYLVMGAIGGFCGQIIRTIELRKTDKKPFLISFIEVLVWTVLGSTFALVLDIHPLISLVVGLAVPGLYKLTQESSLVQIIFSNGLKVFGGNLVSGESPNSKSYQSTPSGNPVSGNSKKEESNKDV